MHIILRRDLKPIRGYFDFVTYIAGTLTIEGWVLSPETPLNKAALFINGRYIGVYGLIKNEGVARAFTFIPHALNSGFSISAQVDLSSDELTSICVVAMHGTAQIGCLQTCFSKTVADKLILRDKNLMHRVAHTEETAYFMASGFKSFFDFWNLVRQYADPQKIVRILDWGCGCGRLAELLVHLAEEKKLYGCDIDAEAINWCTQNLRGIQFDMIPFLPPTSYPDNFFDLIIGASVFTHLARDMQLLWLQELYRIVRKDGFVLATVHGEDATFFQFHVNAPHILKDGIHDSTVDHTLGDIVPTGYYRGTYQSQAYTRREFGKYFNVIDYRKMGSLNFQDIVVMKK